MFFIYIYIYILYIYMETLDSIRPSWKTTQKLLPPFDFRSDILRIPHETWGDFGWDHYKLYQHHQQNVNCWRMSSQKYVSWLNCNVARPKCASWEKEWGHFPTSKYDTIGVFSSWLVMLFSHIFTRLCKNPQRQELFNQLQDIFKIKNHK